MRDEVKKGMETRVKSVEDRNKQVKSLTHSLMVMMGAIYTRNSMIDRITSENEAVRSELAQVKQILSSRNESIRAAVTTRRQLTDALEEQHAAFEERTAEREAF